MINSRTVCFGLIGSSLKYSLSPHIHNYIFKKYSLNAVYLCFEVEAEHLKKLREAILSLGIKGVNVTIPYKEEIIPLLDHLDKEAKMIGAVNTVKADKGKLYGFNTDGEGFIRSLQRYRFSPQDKKIFILGAGGAAKAISVYLARENPQGIFFYDIIYKKASDLAKRIKHFFPQVEVKALKEKSEVNLQDIDLLVNASGVGLKEDDPLVIEIKDFKDDLVVYDLIYNPLQTRLLKEAKRKNLTTINGLWMLIYQAIRSLEIWWEREFSGIEEMIYYRLVREMKKDKSAMSSK